MSTLSLVLFIALILCGMVTGAAWKYCGLRETWPLFLPIVSVLMVFGYILGVYS